MSASDKLPPPNWLKSRADFSAKVGWVQPVSYPWEKLDNKKTAAPPRIKNVIKQYFFKLIFFVILNLPCPPKPWRRRVSGSFYLSLIPIKSAPALSSAQAHISVRASPRDSQRYFPRQSARQSALVRVSPRDSQRQSA